MQKLNFNKQKNLKVFSNMPQMAETLTSWLLPLTLIRVTQSIIDGFAQFKEEEIKFQGVWQPLKDEQLQFLPENQRSWEWIWIHAKASDLNLETADKVIFNNKRYKVMAVKDYSLNSFIEYQLVRDYETLPQLN